MSAERYPDETYPEDSEIDDGTMSQGVEALRQAVVGHRIIAAERIETQGHYPYAKFVITLDSGKRVVMRGSGDCCAYTELESFLLNPTSVDHVIMGVGTTGEFTTWHIYADWGDILRLTVGWSCGNPFYYGYGFDITVEDIAA